MRGKAGSLSVIVVSFLILGLVVCCGGPLLAQEGGQGDSWRPAMQKRALQSFMTFTGLGMLFIVGVAVGIATLAIQLWARVTFPNRTAAILAASDGNRWKLFFVGLVNLVFLFAVFLVCCNVRLLGWLGLITGMAILAIVFLGLLAKSERLGVRVLTTAGRTPDPIGSILVGWPVLYFAAMVPLIGWVLLFYLAVSGAGAVVLSFMSNGKPEAKKS